MQKPDEVLKVLAKQSSRQDYQFKRLYRLLYNPEFYLLAFQNIYANQGSLTAGSDTITLDGISVARIDAIIAKVKDHTYKPQPVRRTYIAKKNSGKKRPLGISQGNDKLLQEVVRMILESIYEPEFSNKSHGFRPKRSCHTALEQIQKTFTGTSWFIEGDIRACFDSFDHQVMIGILRKKIKDEAFLELLWKFLKAGYLENFKYIENYGGVAQGSGCSPVLANIYLNELDKYIMEYAKKYDTRKEVRAKANPAYTRATYEIARARRQNKKEWETLTKEERRERRKKFRVLLREQYRHQPHTNKGRKWMEYVRYADDFIIGIGGSKADAEKIKMDIHKYLKQTLKLELSMEKTAVTHTSERAKFLGYEISILRDNSTKTTKRGIKARVHNHKVRLYMPKKKWQEKLVQYGAGKTRKSKDGKEKLVARERPELIGKEAGYIVSVYNSEIRGLYNYYSIAINVSALGHFCGLMKYSMLKTMAAKYRSSAMKIKRKFSKNGIFTVENREGGTGKAIEFYHEGFRRKHRGNQYNNGEASAERYGRKKDIIIRLRAGICELCSQKQNNLEIHMVKKLNKLSGKFIWEQRMQKMHRKTLVVCSQCHGEIHSRQAC